MATTKKTTTSKKTATKCAKPAPAPEQPELPTQPAPAPEPEYVDYIIPKRAGFMEVDQYFEYCRNGVVYRFRRGVVLHHPREIYETVMQKENAADSVSEQAAAFMNTSKKLN